MPPGSEAMQQQLAAFAVLEWLQDHVLRGTEEEEGLETASQCVADYFGVDLQNSEQVQALSIRPATLPALVAAASATKARIGGKASSFAFETSVELEYFHKFINVLRARGYFNINEKSAEHQGRYSRAYTNFKTMWEDNDVSSMKPAEIEEMEVDRAADLFKNEGNLKMSSSEYQSAMNLYTKAIELRPNNHVYYTLRAAANSYLGLQNKAVLDCEKAIQLQPGYANAYSRLGFAHFSLKRYREALELGYSKALELEPTNETYRADVELTERYLEKLENVSTSADPNADVPRGLGGHDLQSLMQNHTLTETAHALFDETKGSSKPDPFAVLMKNPVIMQMADNIMANPGVMGNVMNLFGGLYFNDPVAAKQKIDTVQAADAAAEPLANIMGDEFMHNLSEKADIEVLRDNTAMKSMMDDINENGFLAAMKYMGDPQVMAVVSSMMTGSLEGLVHRQGRPSGESSTGRPSQ